MPVTTKAVRAMADEYTAAWNSGSPEAAASFHADDGRIVIDRGDPWQGRARVAEMAAGFFADVPDLSLVCEGARRAGDHVVCLRRFTGHDATGAHGWRSPAGRDGRRART